MEAAASRAQEPHGSLLRLPNFRLLWLAHLTSQFGDGMYSVALPWLVYQHTRSGTATAATLAAGAFAFLIVGPIAGVYVDRWDWRRTMIRADLLRALVLTVFPLWLLTGFNLAAVIGVAVLLPALSRFFSPAQRASVPGLAPKGRLVSANALMEGAGNAAFIAGPAVAAVALVAWGAVVLLFLDGVTFLCSALLLSFARFAPAGSTGSTRRAIWSDLAQGFRICWSVPALRGSCLLAALVTVCFAPLSALLPLWVGRDSSAGSKTFSLLIAVFFVGGFLGSMIIGRIGARFARGPLITVGVLVMGTALFAFGWTHQLVAGAVELAIVGCFLSCYNVGVLTLLQQVAPPDAVGRVFAVNETCSWSLRAVAVLGAGAASDIVGAHSVFVGLGVGMFGVGAGSTMLRHAYQPVALQNAA